MQFLIGFVIGAIAGSMAGFLIAAIKFNQREVKLLEATSKELQILIDDLKTLRNTGLNKKQAD